MITSETEIETGIDWLSVTSEKMYYPALWTRECTPLDRGRLGYNRGVEYTDGRIELWHDTREDMGTHVVMSGKCLVNMAARYKTTSEEIVSFFSFARATRIDIVVDVKRGYLDIGGLADGFQRGQCKTRARESLHMVNGGTRGETLYIGSAKGDRRMRIYDKSAEQGTDYEWTRIELQVRHKPATRTMMTLVSRNVSPESIRGAILDFAEWESDREWKMAMGSESISMIEPEVPVRNRLNWILTTCAKAIANEKTDTPSVMQLLSDAVKRELESIRLNSTIVDRNELA